MGELGKDVVRGVTMLPLELVTSALFGESAVKKNEKDAWANEWLRDKDKKKPPISEREGKATTIDPVALSKKSTSTASEMNAIRQRLAAQYMAPQRSQEVEPETQKPQPVKRVAAAPLPNAGSVRKRGDWMHGVKRKRSPSPTDLNRTEYTGNKGAQ